jgi:hypothetical protein
LKETIGVTGPNCSSSKTLEFLETGYKTAGKI